MPSHPDSQAGTREPGGKGVPETRLSIVFDLDGTLVDTAPDLIRATNRILHRFGYRTAEPTTLRPQISHGARSILVRTLREQGVTLEKPDLDRLEQELLTDYGENIAVDSVPYPGVVETLAALSTGAILSVCTNKKTSLASALLRALGLDGFFKAVCGRDSFAVQKPHKDHLLLTIAAAAGDARHAIMIGDSEVDVIAARRAGVPVIAMTYGYCAEPVSSLGADRVLDTFAALPAAIRSVLEGVA